MDTHMPQAAQFSKVCDILERYDHQASKLIPILQDVQAEYRYLPEDILMFVATSLDLPPARVYGVATFYAHFTLTPKGRHLVRLCDGTACHVKGSMAILEALRKRLNLPDGQDTTPDLLFTVETVSCLGACGLAPALVVDDRVHGQVTPDDAVAIIDDIIEKETD